MTPRHPWSGPARVLAGIVLLQLAWLITLPSYRGPDEIEHLKRASSVAAGDLRPVPYNGAAKGELVAVEVDVADALHDRCAELHRDFDPESCLPIEDTAATAPNGAVLMASVSARYNPVWYALVGPASWFLEDGMTLWAARGINAALSALLLWWAWLRWRDLTSSPWAISAMLLCLTPAVTFASIVVAPNGLHYPAGLLLWVALLTRRPRGTPDPARSRAIGLAATLLVTTHTLGIIWVPCVLAGFVVLRGRGGAGQLWRDVRAAPTWPLGAVAAFIASVAWVMVVRTNDPSGGDPLAQLTKESPALVHGVVWVFQLVGTMPFRFSLLWPVVYALWIGGFVIQAVSCLRRPHRRTTLALALVCLIAVAVPVAATVATYDGLGYAWQGRYELPLLFGVPLLAGISSTAAAPRWWPLTIATVLGVSAALAVLCLGLRQDGTPWVVAAGVAASAVGWLLLAADLRPGGRDRGGQARVAATQRSSTA